MENSLELITSQWSASVKEARAGLIFASDCVEAELLAAVAHISPTVQSYRGLSADKSDERAIESILLDLRHYCERNGLRFEKLNAAARGIYRADRKELGLDS
ncbi:MAG: hypothetical protein ACLPWF_19410 [Bryobacteraceae bacterium]